jgi:hypothetical protein
MEGKSSDIPERRLERLACPECLRTVLPWRKLVLVACFLQLSSLRVRGDELELRREAGHHRSNGGDLLLWSRVVGQGAVRNDGTAVTVASTS